MEASEAQQGEAAEAQTAPEGEATEAAAQSPEISEQLLERFDGFRNDVTDRFSKLEERLPQQEQEQEPRYFRDEFTNELVDERGNPVDENQIREQKMLAQMQQMVSPLQEQIQRQQEQLHEYDMGAVMDEFPALDDPQVAEPFMQQVTQNAQLIGSPELAGNPEFVRMQWLAQLGEKAAAQETPAGGPAGGQVETGAASVPAVPEDPAKAILEAARGAGSSARAQFWQS